MSESKTIKNPSPLVLTVLALDEHFTNLNRLADRIDEIDLKSNFDFEQSEKLILRFTESGQAISTEIARFVTILNETRGQAELAAQKVSAKADHLKLRKDEVQKKLARFEILSEKVSQLNQSLVHFRRPAGESFSDQELAELKTSLTTVSNQLEALIEESRILKEIGHDSKIKILEQNAESMRQSLIAVSQKISGMMTLQ
ncbi:MAG: hypothetical protein ACAH59_05135 [Pseudobdellovibrionaceae bacterium]